VKGSKTSGTRDTALESEEAKEESKESCLLGLLQYCSLRGRVGEVPPIMFNLLLLLARAGEACLAHAIVPYEWSVSGLDVK